MQSGSAERPAFSALESYTKLPSAIAYTTLQLEMITQTGRGRQAKTEEREREKRREKTDAQQSMSHIISCLLPSLSAKKQTDQFPISMNTILLQIKTSDA